MNEVYITYRYSAKQGSESMTEVPYQQLTRHLRITNLFKQRHPNSNKSNIWEELGSLEAKPSLQYDRIVFHTQVF